MGGPTFGVLGPLQVRAAGAPVRIGGSKPRAILATLLLQPGGFVSLDLLTEILWPAGAPRSAVANVRTYVRALRQALSEAGVATCGLSTESSGYAFDVPPGDIDLLMFEERLDRARAERDRGSDAAALRGYESALGLWRGSVLQDVPSSVVWDPAITRAEEARSVAVDECLEVRLRTGDYAPLMVELRARLTEDPLREDLWRMLVRALHELGPHHRGQGRVRRSRAVTRRRARHRAERVLAQPPGKRSTDMPAGAVRCRAPRCASCRWTWPTSPAVVERSRRWRGCCRRPAGSPSSRSCRARPVPASPLWRCTWHTVCAMPFPTVSSSSTWAGRAISRASRPTAGRDAARSRRHRQRHPCRAERTGGVVPLAAGAAAVPHRPRRRRPAAHRCVRCCPAPADRRCSSAHAAACRAFRRTTSPSA